MNTLKQIMLPTLVLISSTLFGQIVSWDVEYEDFTNKKTAIAENQIIHKPILLERDVKYSKRIHRVIDLRQKFNKVLAWDRNPFVKFLHESVLRGDIPAYWGDSLSMNRSYTTEEVNKLGSSILYFQSIDESFGGEEVYKEDSAIISFEWHNVTKLRIMEEWLFDSKHSTYKPRITGIAIMYEPVIEGVKLNEQPLYWLQMDQIRSHLNGYEVFNRHNNSARLSADDFFEMRLFSSYIVKEDNVFDLDINRLEEYNNNGESALLRGEEIQNDLFIFEHDIWEY